MNFNFGFPPEFFQQGQPPNPSQDPHGDPYGLFFHDLKHNL